MIHRHLDCCSRFGLQIFREFDGFSAHRIVNREDHVAFFAFVGVADFAPCFARHARRCAFVQFDKACAGMNLNIRVRVVQNLKACACARIRVRLERNRRIFRKNCRVGKNDRKNYKSCYFFHYYFSKKLLRAFLIFKLDKGFAVPLIHFGNHAAVGRSFTARQKMNRFFAAVKFDRKRNLNAVL